MELYEEGGREGPTKDTVRVWVANPNHGAVNAEEGGGWRSLDSRTWGRPPLFCFHPHAPPNLPIFQQIPSILCYSNLFLLLLNFISFFDDVMFLYLYFDLIIYYIYIITCYIISCSDFILKSKYKICMQHLW